MLYFETRPLVLLGCVDEAGVNSGPGSGIAGGGRLPVVQRPQTMKFVRGKYRRTQLPAK